MHGFSRFFFTLPALILARSAFGFVAGVIMLFTHGCGGPPLEPWHTEKLSSELTLRRAEEVRTFDDYRKLEDELFDINQFAVRSTLVVSDPAPLTDRLDKASGGN